jgi:catechol 2,3-dioxygenase-like lactoylglutathione lyase family enzyme
MPEIAGINHVSITVTDIDRSVAWYEEVLGLTKLFEAPHPADEGHAVILGKPDFSMCVGLHVHPTNESERFSEARTGLDHVGFAVTNRDELRAWEARLTELGVDHSGFNDQDMYAVVVFRDPDNVQLEFFTMA